MQLLVALRLHGQHGQPLALAAVLDGITRAVVYADRVLVLVSLPPDLLAELTAAVVVLPKVVLQVVEPWGKFTFALNVAVQHASDNGFEVIAFQSVEMRVKQPVISALLSLFTDERVLVVGPVLEGHEFSPGEVSLRGRTCPWNTLALWRVDLLGLTGFPSVADGREGVEAGVEEVSTVALLKHLRPEAKAVLVSIRSRESIHWDLEAVEADAERRAWHEKKMRSKDDRPAKHLQLLGLPPTFVEHVVL